jgi:hypothetical protein
MTLAAVLPQVVGALRAFDLYERGVALNQLAQVRAYLCPWAAAGGQLCTIRPLIHICRLVVCPAWAPASPAHRCMDPACAPHTCICTPHGCGRNIAQPNLTLALSLTL